MAAITAKIIGSTAIMLWACKNAIATMCLSMPVAALIIVLPEIKTDVAFWGMVGGLTGWIATGNAIGMGLRKVVVGTLAAMGLDGASIPGLSQIITDQQAKSHLTIYLIGIFAIIVYEPAERWLKKRFGGQDAPRN